MVATSSIIAVKFGLNGTEEIISKAPFEIKNAEIIKDNNPAPDGVYDTAMGSTEKTLKCSTCMKIGGQCLGHNGHVKLKKPAFQPMPFSAVIKWLKIICHKCGKPHSCNGTYDKCISIMKKKQATSRNKKASPVSCIYCQEIQRKYSINPKSKLIHIAEVVDASGREIEKIQLMPEDIEKIFNNVSDETMKTLGLSDISHPNKLLISAFQVPANTTRPQNLRSINGSKTNADDITKMAKHLVEKANNLANPESIKDKKNSKAPITENDTYIELIYNLVQYIKGPVTGEKVPLMQNSDGEPLKSIANRTKSKQGTLRKFILGKRAWNLCRSTITGNPRQPIASLGFPMSFAQTIKKREVFRYFNETRLKTLVANARIKQYPMAVNIIKPGNRMYPVSSLDSGAITLNYGDTVEYNLMDGDYVNFNRQPTLELCSISSHFLIVHKNPNAKTLSMNVIACDFYNADFDGDEMNTQHAKFMNTTFELRAISAFNNFVISSTNSSPQIGQINDSIVGLYMLTKHDVTLNREEAMSLFANTTFLPKFEKESYTGRDIITLCLQKTPVNYRGTPTSFISVLEPYMNYDPSEKTTVIENGVMVSGVLDKASIGSGGHKNLYHIIERDYGAQAMIDVMFNMQQISIDFILLKGFSLGTKDVLMPEGARARICEEESNLINESKLITEGLNRGAIIPPIGKTHREFYEELQKNALQPGDVYNEIILRNISRDNNGLLNIILSGSKGKLNNLMAISARSGQMLINGERLRENAGYRRTTVYATRFDDEPSAYGYITNSFISGQTAAEFFSNASNARFDLITKALSTSVTGDKNRNAVKNLENIFVDNMFRCVRSRNIVQLVEGEDGFDSQKIERVKLWVLRMSSEEITKKYASTLEDDYVKAIIVAKEKSAKALLNVARMKIASPMEAECSSPFDIDRIILNKIGRITKTSNAGNTAKNKNYKQIADFVNMFPRMFLNTKYKGPVHEQFKSAMTNIQTYCLSSLAEYSPWLTADQLQVIFDECCAKFYDSLCDPGTAIGIRTGQCVCAPMTQYMLDSHTRSASGGTAKSSMDQVQEIVGATVPEKLSNPGMYLVPIKEYLQDKSMVQIIANEIEVMKFGRFVNNFDPFFEEYGAPVHPKYKHESEDIEKFNSISMQKRPVDLINWCIRYELNKSELILKGMSVNTIVKSLREQNENCYFMYTSDIQKSVYIRQYFRPMKKEVDEEIINKLANDTIGQVVRGIPGIKSAQVVSHSYTDDNYQDQEGWAIKTAGINLRGVVTKEGLDPTQCHSSSIIEIERFLGVCAARNKIIVELDVVASGGDPRHKFLYADEMTRIGRVVSIERPGLAVREPTDILGRAALSSPAKAYSDAALNRTAQEIIGVSDSLILGDIPKVGTTYNQKIVDPEFIRNNIVTVNDFDSEFD